MPQDSAPVLRWYLVHTKPSGESLAQANLGRQGYEMYLPRVAQPVRHGGAWRERIVPLFPRYLFLRVYEGRQSLGPVRSSVGVSTVVRFGTSYAVVPDRIVNDLQARADPESGLHRLSRSAPLVPGAQVRISMGPFDGLQGIFEREAGAERVVVLLDLLGRDASVRIPSRFVLPSHAA